MEERRKSFIFSRRGFWLWIAVLGCVCVFICVCVGVVLFLVISVFRVVDSLSNAFLFCFSHSFSPQGKSQIRYGLCV